jgi:hypothetical protein
MPLHQVAEKGIQLRSRVAKILDVALGYASGFGPPAASLDCLFEQPARRKSSTSGSLISLLYETYASGKIGNTYCAQFGLDRFFCFSSSNNYAVCRLRRPSKKFLSSHPNLP